MRLRRLPLSFMYSLSLRSLSLFFFFSLYLNILAEIGLAIVAFSIEHY